MQMNQRLLIGILREVCEECGIVCRVCSDGWILRLERGAEVRHVSGFKFDANAAASSALCDDKYAASEVMELAGVPHIRHHFFLSPNNVTNIGPGGNWQALSALLLQYGTLVCKPNDGTGGKQVFRVHTQAELERAAYEIFRKNRAMAVCQYVEIDEEYRAVLLDDEVQLVFSKTIPSITGDGVRTVRALCGELFGTADFSVEVDCPEDTVLAAGERLALNWKHNLNRGNVPVVLDHASPQASEQAVRICALARRAAHILNVKFASVDIVSTKSGLQVLEVNSGVMMERFAGYSDEHYGIAKGIYKRAVRSMFGLQ